MKNIVMNKPHSVHEVTNILKKKNQEFVLNKELIKAVEINHLLDVQQLIEQDGATLHKLNDMQLHLYNSEHDTLLHTAVKLGYVEIVKYLISCGCNVNARTRRERAPLHYAMYPSVPIVMLEILINNGAELEIKDDDNASPFMWACYLNNVEAVKLLIDKKVDVHTVDNFELSPLEWACYQNNLETVILLTNIISYSELQLKHAYEKAIENGKTQTANFLGKQLG